MGGSRKRPAERTPAPNGDGERRKEGKPNKKKKSKNKQNKEATTDKAHESSLETTATAEGKIMAQVLSTFSRLEQSRFDAFRRATFPVDAISKYVAHCVIQQKGGDQQPRRRPPILSEVCAPGQSEEISIVVSTLAKAYAQRLITAARRNAEAANEPITPDDILRAHQERTSQGLDPGFFLQPAASRLTLALKDDSYERKRLATLQAQEDYDKEHGAPVSDDDQDDMDITTDPQTPQNDTSIASETA